MCILFININESLKQTLTISVCNLGSASEDGNHDNAHDHQEVIDDRDVNLAHQFSRSVDDLQPGEAPEGHGLLHARKRGGYHSLTSNHSCNCGNDKHWPEKTIYNNISPL